MKKLLLLLLPLLLLSSCSSTLTGFNKHNTINHVINHGKPYGYTTSTKIVRKGKESQRFEIRHGDCSFDKDWSDCDNDRRRYERYVKPVLSEKPGGVVWYAWSLYLPNDFKSIYPANTTLGQVKIHGYSEPLVQFVGRKKGIRVHLDANYQECKLIKYEDAIGKWTDFLIKVDYNTKEESDKLYSEIYVNGVNRNCGINEPVLTKEVLETRNKDKTLKINFRYGIYNSYVSKWLNKNKNKEVDVKGWKHVHVETGMVVNSATNKPWDVDWGIKLPTQVVYYDEVRIGPTRESVDINMNDPVD
jgi:hypothetical protein